MIYVVKCYYCEHEFRVKRGETGADMMCPECGKANSIRDVVERIEDASAKKKVDSDIAEIKAFDMAQHPVINDETYYHRKDETDFFERMENASTSQVIIYVVVVTLVIISAIISALY